MSNSEEIFDHATQITITREVKYIVARCSKSRCGRTDVPTQQDMENHCMQDFYEELPVMHPFEHYWPAGWTRLTTDRYGGGKQVFCPDCRPK